MLKAVIISKGTGKSRRSPSGPHHYYRVVLQTSQNPGSDADRNDFPAIIVAVELKCPEIKTLMYLNV